MNQLNGTPNKRKTSDDEENEEESDSSESKSLRTSGKKSDTIKRSKTFGLPKISIPNTLK